MLSSSEGRDIEPFDWFNRFFGGSRRNRGWGLSFPDVFRSMDEMGEIWNQNLKIFSKT